jgi:hypothetical protein
MPQTAIDPKTNQLVSPEEFVARHPAWRSKGLRPRCALCGVEVTPHAVHSPNMASSFHHPDGSTCLLSSTPDPHFAGLRPADADLEQEARLLAQLRNPEVVEHLYCACRSICERLSCEEFLDMCAMAHRLHIWRYKGMTIDLAAFAMTTMADLPKKDGRPNPMRVVLRKPKSHGPGDFFVTPESCELEKVFPRTGERYETRDQIRVLDPDYLPFRQDTAWMSDRLRQCVRRCHLKDPSSSSRPAAAS